jgi:hypothetical protein
LGTRLQTIANALAVPIAGTHWQIDGTGDNTKVYQLTVVGSRNRRAIKLFTSRELDCCLSDQEQQSEINTRLTRLVTFLGGRAKGESARRTARKHQ